MMSGCVPEQESESAPESNSFAEMYGKNLTAPIVTVEQSPPLRGRGLKQGWYGQMSADLLVAPPAGARIETTNKYGEFGAKRVAPPAGARIETWTSASTKKSKLVAPPAGARIETLATR